MKRASSYVEGKLRHISDQTRNLVGRLLKLDARPQAIVNLMLPTACTYLVLPRS
jgi:hypothetical protein